nr:transporter substrate-binding domain-containing protein [Pseudoalteromonas sp. TB64]
MYTDQFPPYNFKNNEDQFVGINTDIVKTLCVKAKINCQFKQVPWKRAYSSVQKKG